MTIATIGYYDCDPASEMFALVTVEYWNAYQGMDSEGSEEDIVPPGFYAVSDAIYEHEFASLEEAKAALEQAGFEERAFVPR